MSELPEQRVPIARTRRLKKAHEYGLVVLSGKSPYWVEKSDNGWLLLVPEEGAEHFREQVLKYHRESRHWPPEPVVLPEHAFAGWPLVIWSVLLIGGFLAQDQWPDLLEAGRVSSRDILAGEGWRAWTALLLHGDIGHLVANLVFGGCFLFCAIKLTGPATALLTTFLAGGFGNLLNAVVLAGSDHLSIGASTAVFSSVGLLASYPVGYGLRPFWQRRAWAWWIPLGVGVALLGWFGTGDERTDVTAHLFGFLCALPLGFALGWRRRSSN